MFPALCLALLCADPAPEIALGENTLHLATVAEGREVLGRVDAFTREWSRFDLEIRLGRTEEVDEAAVRKSAADQVIPWEERDAVRVRAAAKRIQEKLAGLQFDLPRPTLLIHTTGRDESNAAYCRQNAVILPRNTDAWNEDRFTKLLLHELFHAWSRANPEPRVKLYAAIGFTACPPVELPAAWKDRKMTNPDGPSLDWMIRLKTDAGERLAVPLLYADPPRFNAETGTSLFKYMKFKLIAVRVGDERTEVVTNPDTGEPVLLDPKSVPSYFEQIGNNTAYIIHPDEILAENFVQLVLGDGKPATPRVHEEMRKILGREEGIKTAP